MELKRLAMPGVLTALATGVVAIGLAMSGPGPEPDQTNTTPAGQVADLPSGSSSTSPDAPTSTTVSQDAPQVSDDGPVNTPADVPVDEVPPPGVPYDSDGGTVVPNPPDLGPGELAPRPPTQDPVEPAPAPVDPPVPPSDDTVPSAG